MNEPAPTPTPTRNLLSARSHGVTPAELAKQIKKFLLNLGFQQESEYDITYPNPPAKTYTPDPTPIHPPLYSSIAWQPMVENRLQMLWLWPSQISAHLKEKRAHQYKTRPQPDMHSPLQGTPPTLLSKIGVHIWPQETNPDMDILPNTWRSEN